MRFKALFVTTCLLIGFLSGPISAQADRTASIENIPPTPLGAPADTSMPRIAAAIKLAALSQNWEIIGESPGAMTARLHIRAHTADVVIAYTEKKYQIDYLDSDNLDFKTSDYKIPASGPRQARIIKGPRIHRNYNVWVKKLSRSIQVHARNPPPVPAEPPSTAKNPLLIADELEKLDSLRQRGILTQEEFDQQKARLLE